MQPVITKKDSQHVTVAIQKPTQINIGKFHNRLMTITIKDGSLHK